MSAILRLYVEYLVTAAAAMVAAILIVSVFLLCIIVPALAKVLVVVLIAAFGLALLRLSYGADDSSRTFKSSLPPPPSGPTSFSQPAEIRRPEIPQLPGPVSVPLELQGIPERLQLKAAPEDPIVIDRSLLQVAAKDEDNLPEERTKSAEEEPE